ncbi:glycosyltransferase family 4 protein [Kaistia terrae]|uniref:Glycosyltransferase family 4 protein n=1 Tax=Kaistia terrae TaxID=537017 RepID=A0ABW0Q2Z7_9HYPH|nr:glycosyltransferase family 4 protein [Kaistia terrae]MCX5578605.1 glycosyltransferase family 4 protein [Kaistia terrae]
MKFAFFGYPHLGGTYSVFRQLRTGLAAFDIELEWLGVGHSAHAAGRDLNWQSEWSCGSACGMAEDSEPAQSRAMLSHLAEQKFDGVLVSVHADRVQTNLARYLPASMLRVMIVHNITPATYAAARAIRDHVHMTVCVSQRIREDLVARYAFAANATHMIHNAVDLPAPPPRPRRAVGQPLRLLSLGRIEDQAKGVLWLPEILARLPPDVTLTVAGDGPDLARLRRAAASLGERIQFLGSVAPAEVPTLMASHDVFIAPSRFEGFMVTLLEAMACSCVPVVSRIRGGTDAAINDGVNGLLFPVGDVKAAANAVLHLQRNPKHWHAMACEGPIAVHERFGNARMAQGYAALLGALREHVPTIAPPMPIETWDLPRGLRDSLRSRLPTPLKNFLRSVRERAA